MAKGIRKKTDHSIGHGETGSDRETCISVTAYYLAEKRGFAWGHELNDWLAAEISVDGPTNAALR